MKKLIKTYIILHKTYKIVHQSMLFYTDFLYKIYCENLGC
nr:MAG TPA: hypothetical protein [Caudoviricetes sp.]